MKDKKSFTLITRDCIGGILYHQFGMKFLSPTINLFFTPEDFNYFVLNLKSYINGRLVESKEEDISYPVGLLYPRKNSSINKPIKIHFMHYDNYKIAKAKWNERKRRINYKNIFVISSFCYSTEVNFFTPEIRELWNQIKYPKVVFVEKSFGFDDEYKISRPKECKEFAWLLYIADKNNPSIRTFNEFDFDRFIEENYKD